MELSEKSRKELQQILQKDYGAELMDSQVNTLGVSLLRLARLARLALSRAEAPFLHNPENK